MADRKQMNPGRRQFIMGAGAAALGLAAWGRAERVAAAAPQAAQGTGPTADEALQQLMQGNQRFVAGTLTAPSQMVERRADVAPSQHPIAAIVACADSRVPPELVFDRGLGDLFVARLAGNVVDKAALGSIEYAVDGLGVPLVMVLGHESCGAVGAAVQAVQGNAYPPYLFHIVEKIAPAARSVLGRPGDVGDNAIRANAELVVRQLKASEPILEEDVNQGRLRIVGAYYSLASGAVSIIG